MNISDITTQGSSMAERKTAFGANSFLNIGKKGQTVEGTISNVSEQISINFNGVEVAVSGSAVQNAKEGETRKFKIMDVSKDNIVLKEVGNNTDAGETRAMMGTSVGTSSYTFSDYLSDSQMASEANQEAGQNLSVLTGEDYQSIESEQGALEEYKESELDRAIERKKEKTQWQKERQQAYHEFRQESEAAQEKIQAMGFLELKSPQQIAKILEEADIPVSDSGIAKVTSALQMAQEIQNLSDNARAYIIQNQLPPTIENLYHGQYSGIDGVSAEFADEETWQLLLPQVTDILSENNIDLQTGLFHAKWLFANDLPVTADSLQNMQVLDEVQKLSGGQVMEQILQAMSSGAAPEKASLDNTQFVAARIVLQEFADVTAQDIEAAVSSDSGVEVTLQLLKEMKGIQTEAVPVTGESQSITNIPVITDATKGITRQEMAVLTTKRQLEEIRLKMTLQSVVKMQEKGINIEITPLKELVDELRQMENTYFAESLHSDRTEMTMEQGSLLQETLAKVTDIKNAPAAILGSSVRQQQLLTVNQIHKAAVSATVQMQRYQIDFEAIGTQVRKDLGDSINKAFANIPDLLEELQMEDTLANQRAVRILGYNRMEVSEENIQLVKENDARVNFMIASMKPSIVMELIRQGRNPLDIPLDELNQQLQEIEEEQGVSSEEKYSRYLWQLEQENGITASEREGYIGIYRLLNQIEKTDGAAIGAVLDADKELTLGNLLTAVRTIKGKGIDARIDDSFGGLTKLQYSGKSITEQLERGFSGSMAQSDDGSESDGRGYYQQLVSKAIDIITPSAVQQISDGDMEQLLNTSLEKFKEQLEKAGGNPHLEHIMYEEFATELREVSEKSQQATKYLSQMDIPSTMANLQAAEMLLEQGYDVQKEAFAKKKLLSKEEQKDYEAQIVDMPEGLESEEAIAAHYKKLEGYLEKILEKSYEQKEVSSLDLRNLKLFAQGIQLQSQLAGRHSYDIPIMTGDTVTSLNVTLIQGIEENGKVQINITSSKQQESEEEAYVDYGNISMEFKVSAGEIKGLILCDTRLGYDRLRQENQALLDTLTAKGFQVKALSYGMDYQSRSDMAGGVKTENTPTAQLYQVAKAIVQHTIQTIKEASE